MTWELWETFDESVSVFSKNLVAWLLRMPPYSRM